MKVGLVRGRYFVLKRILYTLGEPGLVCARNLYQVGRPLVPRGFVKCFLRVPRLLGCTAATLLPQQSKGNFLKIYYKTFGTSGRPTWYSNVMNDDQPLKVAASECSTWWRQTAPQNSSLRDGAYHKKGHLLGKFDRVDESWHGAYAHLLAFSPFTLCGGITFGSSFLILRHIWFRSLTSTTTNRELPMRLHYKWRPSVCGCGTF